jgi:phosphoribosylanthranilate isomerase
MTKIKICGLSRPQDIHDVNEARPDWCGFILNYPKSRRNVTPEKAAELIRSLRADIVPVGVFVDQPAETIIPLARENLLRAVQLHGRETPEYIRALQREIRIPVIKAFRIQSEADLRTAEESPADLILLDSGRGTGKPFDWSLLRGLSRPWLLAGGLGPDNLEEAIARFHPWGVDMSSGVETNGRKDREKILRTVAIAHQS